MQEIEEGDVFEGKSGLLIIIIGISRNPNGENSYEYIRQLENGGNLLVAHHFSKEEWEKKYLCTR